MNKKTKLWLGVGVVAAAAYYFWNKSKTAPASAPAATTPAVKFALDGAPCPANKDEKYVGIDAKNGILYCSDGVFTKEYKVKKSGNK